MPAGHFDIVDFTVARCQEMVVTERSLRSGDDADRLLDSGAGQGTPVLKEFGNPDVGIAGVQRIADRCQPGAIDALMKERPA